MPYDRNRAKGDAVLAGTAGATFGAPIALREAEEKIRPRLITRNAAKQEKVRNRIKRAPAPSQTRPGESYAPRTGKTHKVTQFVGEDPKAKASRSAANKKAAGKLMGLQRRAKVLKKPFYRHQSKLWAGSMAVGIPATIAANRYRENEIRKVDKKVKRSDAAVVGGVTGGALYQGGSLALKPYERKHYESKIKADPKLKAKHEAHRKATLPKNAPAGHKAWRKYSRTIPKDLPGATLRRVQARTHAGKSGVLATMGAVALGGVGGTTVYDKVKKSKPLMTDAEMRRRKQLQGKISQTTSTLGLGGVGVGAAALLASKGKTKGPTLRAIRKVPGLKKATPEGMKEAGLYTSLASGGIGGVGGYNFAAYTKAESRKRQQVKQPVRKSASAFGVVHD